MEAAEAEAAAARLLPGLASLDALMALAEAADQRLNTTVAGTRAHKRARRSLKMALAEVNSAISRVRPWQCMRRGGRGGFVVVWLACLVAAAGLGWCEAARF